jgi:hypothetical protein
VPCVHIGSQAKVCARVRGDSLAAGEVLAREISFGELLQHPRRRTQTSIESEPASLAVGSNFQVGGVMPFPQVHDRLPPMMYRVPKGSQAQVCARMRGDSLR